VGLKKYLRAAFLNQWNLLAFLGGCGFAALSGHFDIVGPLILAGEVGYLGFVGTHPRFQKYIEVQEAQVAREQGAAASEGTIQRILGALPTKTVERFEELCARCSELRQLARDMRDPHRVGEAAPLEDLQTSGLDRLLWIYVRLLFTQYSLERFLKKTSSVAIERDIAHLEERLAELGQPSAGDPPHREKARKVIEDNLETSRARQVNYQKARDNYELVNLEIDRLENKIASLSELAVNRQEPEFISGQIDQVANSLAQTERTMGELQFVTGLQPTDEEVPQILQRERATERR
jgi:hypothetical protein